MDTAQNKLPSSGKSRRVSPGSPLSKSSAIGNRTRDSLKPAGMKSRVIARATREAGSALYEILGIAELMRVAYEKGEMESMRARLSLLISEAANLSTTLTNILELARIETEQATTSYQCFDMAALLEEVSHAARAKIGQKPLTIMDVTSPGPVTIISDPEKVSKIMTGLVSNAVKFTDRGRIGLILNKDEYRIRFTITDTGRGMTAEQMNSAFSSFDPPGNAKNNGHAKSELGLRIIRNLVRLLEGSITVSSKVGEGTIVEVSLPIEPPDTLDDSCPLIGKELPCACDKCR